MVQYDLDLGRPKRTPKEKGKKGEISKGGGLKLLMEHEVIFYYQQNFDLLGQVFKFRS
jgi:hypothetical protein